MENNKEEIVWYLKGKEVGRSVLPEASMGGFRDWLAFNNGVLEYDNVNFLSNGEIRMNGETHLFNGRPYGIFAGKQYSERRKNGYFI